MSDIPENAGVSRKLAAIFAADIAGYSALMGINEEATVLDLKAHQAVILPMISEHGGRVIDTAGDGILVEFASVVKAVECAVAIQKTMAGRNSATEPARRMQFRIGVNIGDVIHDEQRVYGGGVTIAARLEAIAEPGGVCISDKVRQEIRGKMDVTCHDLGEQRLKNIAEPIRVYRVVVDERWPLPRPAHSLPDKASIAVLPFAVFSDEREQEYFGDGVVEDIITALSHFRWLFVIARNSSFTYKGRAVDVKQVGRELGVRYVLEGSVRRVANHVRIIAQLIDATTGAHISADRFDGELKDIFELQEQVATSIAGAIAPKLERAEMERTRRKPTESLDAYGYFMRASAKIYEWTNDANDEALRLLYKAIELDPNFASAYAYATWCYCFRVLNGTWKTTREEEVAEAIRLARRAVELGKDDAFALCWAGYALAYFAGELDDGAAFLDRALQLNPNLARAWNLSGWVRTWRGEPEISIEHLTRAMRLSPLDPAFHAMLTATAFAYFCAGRYPEAISWAEKALREQPNSAEALGILAISSALAGQMERAQKAMARLREIAPHRRLSNLKDRNPYLRPEILSKILEGARKAGMPE